MVFMNEGHGKREWLVADCYWPETTAPGHYVSHEAVCALNTSDRDARIELTLYFEDREPMAGFVAHCPARRTHHIRLDKLTDAAGGHVPMGTPYAIHAVSDVNIIMQYSRLDATQPNCTLATTIAYS